MTEKKCTCKRIPKFISCIKCGFPPTEARFDLGPLHDYDCDCEYHSQKVEGESND